MYDESTNTFFILPPAPQADEGFAIAQAQQRIELLQDSEAQVIENLRSQFKVVVGHLEAQRSITESQAALIEQLQRSNKLLNETVEKVCGF